MPKTLNKIDMLAHNLAIEFKFIKDEYIMKKTNSVCKPSDLYLKFKEYCRVHYTERRINGEHKFYMKLREIGLHSKKSNGHYKYDLKYKELEELFQKRGWIHELDYDKIQDDDDDNNSSSSHDLDFGLTSPIKTQSESSNDLLDLVEQQKIIIEDLQANVQKSLQIQQYLLSVLNDRALYESTKHQVNEIVKNYNGKTPLPTQPIKLAILPKPQIESSKPKRKPLPREAISIEPIQLVQPIEIKKEDLAFQKLKEKLLTSTVSVPSHLQWGEGGDSYDFIDSDDEEEEVDDLNAEINLTLSLF
jgi:hypothetical protein